MLISNYLHTIGFLKGIQVRNQIFNRFGFWKQNADLKTPAFADLEAQYFRNKCVSSDDISSRFDFNILNRSKKFADCINWNFSDYGKLWTYHLNYFNFLFAKDISLESAMETLDQFVRNYSGVHDGKEPYPTSLRIINWVKFLSQHKISNKAYDEVLFKDLARLSRNLEFHLLGNHLLENAFALLFGSYYFKDIALYDKASGLLKEQLREQIMESGAHFERSPMYHQLILQRLLDSIQLLQWNRWRQDNLLNLLEGVSSIMLGWINQMTFSNGDIPLVNDAAFGMAASTSSLNDYADYLNLSCAKINLEGEGYRMIKMSDYELFLDVGNIGPDYQPGHAHADTFNFLIHADGIPFIVDTGISTYEKNEQRLYERSTAAHNTVVVGGRNSSEIWSGFRVARRAYISELDEGGNFIAAVHTGFKPIKSFHKRTWRWEEHLITIEDKVWGRHGDGVAYLHFHPDVNITSLDETGLTTQFGTISFNGNSALKLVDSTYASEFNKMQKGKALAIHFRGRLKTRINISVT